MASTARPWKVLWKHDTHNIKRDRAGRILGPVTMDFEDYVEARAAVNCHDEAKVALQHIRAMADDAYLIGHPEWAEIVAEVTAALAKMA